MRYITKESQLSKSALARIAGVSYTTVHAWLAGTRNPTPQSRRRLADGLDAHSRRLASLAQQVRNSEPSE